MLQFALRLGEHPQQVVTTTPKNVGVLKRILGNASTVTTHAPTDANRAYLAASFLEQVQARYGGTAMVTLGVALGILMSIAKSKRLMQS